MTSEKHEHYIVSQKVSYSLKTFMEDISKTVCICVYRCCVDCGIEILIKRLGKVCTNNMDNDEGRIVLE